MKLKIATITTGFVIFGLLQPTPGFSKDAKSPQLAQAKTTAKTKAKADIQVKKVKRRPSSANRFNRLFRGAAQFNLPPAKDGIHDPDNAGTLALQPPLEAFSEMPRSRSGNRVDWMKALDQKLINPRADKVDEEDEMSVLDLNIVREVKGSMPDVVYPHKQHTEWLECRNCHPKIFIPKKGGNRISMAAILMGQYCGVCHGKVAFPVSQCRKCHSKPKSKQQLADLSKRRKERQKSVTALLAPPPPAVKKAEVQKVALKKPAKVKQMSMKELLLKGKEVYEDNCSACHGEAGEGVPGTFPPIAGSKVAKGPMGAHLKVILDGRNDTAMQAWRDELTLEEIAGVVTFQRNAFGNKMGDKIQPVDIKKAGI